MNLGLFNQSSYQPSMQGLVPLKDYKGVVLKLTVADKKKIAELQGKKADLEIELYKISMERIKKKLSDAQQDYYDNKVFRIHGFIRDIEEQIRKIKSDRLNKQKQCIANLDTKV